MKKIIAGNWKMNGDANSLQNLFDGLQNLKSKNTVIVCPPFTMLNVPAPSNVAIGAQDCSSHNVGAYTGQISARMLADIAVKYVILGHSERRLYNGEESVEIREKALRAIENNITPIICIGETLNQKEQGETLGILTKQLTESLPNGVPAIIAYEPIWAIGTGLVASNDEIKAVHAHLRTLVDLPLLYGGSVNGKNACEILNIKNVDGVLVGGASLKIEDFALIINANGV